MDVHQITCIIAGHEKSECELLAKHINRIPYLTLVAQCSDSNEALIIISDFKPDIVFLDIQMPGLDGLELLALLPTRPKIIVVSGEPKFAINGSDAQVVDHILKPVTFERLARAVLKAKQELINVEPAARRLPSSGSLNVPIPKIVAPEDNFLLVKDSRKLIRLDFEQIYLVEGMKDYLKIYWTSGLTVVHQTMARIEEKLPSTTHLRVHRSFIINKKIIAQIIGNKITTTIGKTVPIGSTYRDSIFKEFSDNML